MGIPAYFSYIIKNHSKIICTIDNLQTVHNLYLDCNSIIYDALYSLSSDTVDIESVIIKTVCEKLHLYIQQIKPENRVLIAFDGVAPVAKLNQQRTRRFRSTFINEVHDEIHNRKSNKWNSSAITPGTNFMDKLGKDISKYFKNSKKFNVKEIIVSASNEPGEGEHKLFDYIRTNIVTHQNQNTIIYGLDADLIMLSINHLPICKNIYLFRETPEFIKQIDKSLDANKLYMIDIPLLANEIILEMNNYQEVDEEYKKNKIYDYIFLCFFLGNDFMPHFPALNIRTNGINIILDVYAKLFTGSDENLTNGKVIYWKNVKKFVKMLAEGEKEYLLNEYTIRDKLEKRNYPSSTPEEKEIKFNSLPTKNRTIEKYIDPSSDGWQMRYYDKLFDVEWNDKRKKQICHNYIEALEWTMKYYRYGCVDWRWKYDYNYAPLLEDLYECIPYFEENFFEKEAITKPVSPLVQLSYVLPRNCLYMLPTKIKDKLLEEYDHCYTFDVEFEWSFCKYFWECHMHLPEIDISKLEKLIL